ncbi:lipopolysaccharide heptosyltransferase II [bacterium]|nr:lipopolysaccharide heptosyltransferase II [bacterium]RQV93462.1 MAG: lipopolysaccharide heptosyltransferase II [bacterium]
MKEIHRMLVIRTDRIGDVVLSLPVITALRRKYPQAHIAMLVHPDVRPIVENLADLNQVLVDEQDEGGIRSLFQLIRNIRREYFDAALLLHPTLRLACAIALARVPIRIGTGYRFYSLLFNRRVYQHRKDSRYHEAEYNLKLAEEVGADVTQVDFGLSILPSATQRVNQLLKEHSVFSKKPLVILHPGSRGSALEWPWSHFAELANRLIKESNAQIAVTGDEHEHEKVKQIIGKNSEKILNLAGRFDLKELTALLKRADLVIANSTGPLHIAAAVGTEVIGLYPPVTSMSARRWGPYNRPSSVLVPDVPECSRCRGSRCSFWNCMGSISVEQVWNMARKKLTRLGFS